MYFTNNVFKALYLYFLKEKENLSSINEKVSQIVGEKNLKLEGFGSLLSDNTLDAQSCFNICENMPECDAATFQDITPNSYSKNDEDVLEKSCVLFEADLYASVKDDNWVSYMKNKNY